MEGFLKNAELLEESFKVNDLLGFEDEIARLDGLLRTIRYQSMVGYIGRFGTGKSTALYQLRKKYEEEGRTKWFDFDAWKYPERKDLWEGFVLDVADQLDKKKRVAKRIDGDSKIVEGVGIVARIAAALKTAGASELISGQLISLFKNKPIERVFQMQELLTEMFKGVKEQTIFIVVEDIDRSGDAGCYFLETLRQFIKSANLEKRVIVLVPIGAEVYEKNDHFRESYHKVFDYLMYFELKNINFDKFIVEVFDAEKMWSSHKESPNVERPVDWKGQIKDWFNIAISNRLTIRDIKLVLRSADRHYIDLVERGFEPHPLIVLCFTLLNHTNDKKNSKFRYIRYASEGERKLTPLNSIASQLLQAIAHGCDVEKFKTGYGVQGDILLVSAEKIKTPILYSDTDKAGEGRRVTYHLSDFYLIPFGLNRKN